MPGHAFAYHPLQRVSPLCTTRVLLFKITTFCPNMTRNNTAASITEAAVFAFELILLHGQSREQPVLLHYRGNRSIPLLSLQQMGMRPVLSLASNP